MKIELVINANLKQELYLHENSSELKNRLLNVIEQFVGKDIYVEYQQEHAQIDSATGETVNYNPYPAKFHYEEDSENYLQKRYPLIVVV